MQKISDSIKAMDYKSVLNMIEEINKKASLQIEDRIRLYLGYMKINYLDKALYHAEHLKNYCIEKGLISDEFLAKHPGISISFDLQLLPNCEGGWSIVETAPSACSGICCMCICPIICIGAYIYNGCHLGRTENFFIYDVCGEGLGCKTCCVA